MAKLRILPDEVTVEMRAGESVLDASLAANVPHAHVCGGHARCSTCRVFVVEGLDGCPARNDAERRLARRLHFPPGIRLACQLHPEASVSVRRLVLDEDDVGLTNQIASEAAGATVGEEKQVAILFSDLRGFTSFADVVPPFDAMHVLGRHFRAMSHVIDSRGGTILNTMGDGLLALFDGADALDSCSRAVHAALDMIAAQADVSAYVDDLYGRPLDMGVGVHFGEVVVGELRIGSELRQTVIGDAVNVASRIENANKELGTRLLVSETVREALGDHALFGKNANVALKGKNGTFALSEVLGVTRAGDASGPFP